MSIFNLKGQVALITGASSGLGVTFAHALAKQGADIAIVARRLDRLEKIAEQIREYGVRAIAIQCDVTDEAQVESAVAKVVKELGKIDILVNNAGIASSGDAEDVTGEEFKKVMDINVDGVFYFAREAGKNMIKNRYGRIINVASMYGKVGNKLTSAIAYHTSKGAVVNFARALATEWGKHGITVNNIAPGFFESEMTDAFFTSEPFLNHVRHNTILERVGRNDELNTALIFLAASGSSYVTGQTIYVDGGWTAI